MAAPITRIPRCFTPLWRRLGVNAPLIRGYTSSLLLDLIPRAADTFTPLRTGCNSTNLAVSPSRGLAQRRLDSGSCSFLAAKKTTLSCLIVLMTPLSYGHPACAILRGSLFSLSPCLESSSRSFLFLRAPFFFTCPPLQPSSSSSSSFSSTSSPPLFRLSGT